MRRHRLNGPEVSPVKDAVENELRAMCQERRKQDELKRDMLFRVWWRLKTHRQGQPAYPEPFTWASVASYMHESMVPLKPLEVIM